uniref:hypothetical protein n=1 Tax=Nonomuraea sp. CA-252377 TaxID=3240003 RepID=UPI003F496594
MQARYATHERYQRTREGWKFAERVDEVRNADATPLASSVPETGMLLITGPAFDA